MGGQGEREIETGRERERKRGEASVGWVERKRGEASVGWVVGGWWWVVTGRERERKRGEASVGWVVGVGWVSGG